MTLVFGNINHLLIFKGVYCWGVVKPEWVAEIDEFVVSEITSALIAHYDHTPFWISAATNKDNLE